MKRGCPNALSIHTEGSGVKDFVPANFFDRVVGVELDRGHEEVSACVAVTQLEEASHLAVVRLRLRKRIEERT